MKNEWSGIASKASKIQGTKNEVLNPVVFALIKKYSIGKKLFDYGCGWGEFADLICKADFDVMAFDDADEMVSQAKAKYLNPNFIFKKDFTEKLPQLKETFDVVVSNLVLCILEKEQQEIMLKNIKSILKGEGIAVISFCHPKYDYLPDSLVSERIAPKNAQYSDEFLYEKEIKENGVKFHDYHRPLEYYVDLFNEYGFKVLESEESDVLGTEYKPDFIIFVLRKK